MRRFETFLLRHRNSGIKNLMLYIIVGNVLAFLLLNTDRGGTILNYFVFYPELILQGQLWRLVTFILIPSGRDILSLILTLYFYYMIGSTLEREWGTLKFNLYYLTGLALTAVYSLLTGTIANAVYLNLSMFFAFATLYPDFQVMLFFIIPLKIKYLAYLNAVFFLVEILFQPFPRSLLPLVAVLNYFLYFYEDWIRIIKHTRRRRTYAANTVSFKEQLKTTKKARGYIHRCTICGKTDTDYPQMEFRYCSLCKDYACYCEEHIMGHEHIV